MFSIQKITLDAILDLQTIARTTFTETFSDSNSKENLNEYLETKFTKEKLSAELQNPDSEFYFVKTNNSIVGYLKLNTASAQTELQDSNALEIERIYVAQEFHGQKVGQLLLDFAIQNANQKKLSYVWLGVWEKNYRAIRFYTKNDFLLFDKHIFVMGNEHQTDYLMKKELK